MIYVRSVHRVEKRSSVPSVGNPFRRCRPARTVAKAADEVGTRRLRPIFEHLGEAVPYDTIRLVARHLEVRV